MVIQKMKIEYKVEKALTDISVRAFLGCQGFSVHLWRKLKHHGTAYINGEQIIPALSTLKADDILTCDIPEETTVKPINGPLEILYEDNELLFLNKPAGILVHPLASGHEASLLNYIVDYFQKTKQELIPHPVHRLDRNTTGIVMVAKLPHIQHLLTQNGSLQFHRKYLAIVHGHLTPAEGVIHAPIDRKPESIIERCVSEQGKPSVTNYHTLAEWDNYSLIEAQPVTGRTHQIRVHCAHLNCPLVGDDLYGGSREFFPRQALHAFRMDLIHPITQKPLMIIAPVPKDFSDFIPKSVLLSSKAFL